jgi:hypothetical protein
MTPRVSQHKTLSFAAAPASIIRSVLRRNWLWIEVYRSYMCTTLYTVYNSVDAILRRAGLAMPASVADAVHADENYAVL